MTSMSPRPPALLGLALAACTLGPYTNTDGSTTTGTSTQSSETGVPVTTGIQDPSNFGTPSTGSTSSTSFTSTSSTSTTSTDPSSTGSTSIVPMDVGGPNIACDPWQQDCPRGEKCMWYAEGGGSLWNATKCVPVMDDPAQIDEPCFIVDNGFSGIDNCDLGLMCWDTDAENMGTCVAYCTGEPAAPHCILDLYCVLSSSGFGLCFDWCDPLAQDCDPGEVCIPTAYDVVCVLDASGDEGQLHDLCEFANACDPGLLCLEPSAAVECDPAAPIGCCEPFCDLTLPNTCPGQGQQCLPWYEPGMGPPGYENVGVCALPG